MREKKFLHCFDLQETFENKIETIVSEKDRTQTARARKKIFLHYFDLQGTFENKIGTTDWTRTRPLGPWTRPADFEGKTNLTSIPRHHVHSPKNPASTYTPLTEYFPFGSPTKLQYIFIFYTYANMLLFSLPGQLTKLQDLLQRFIGSVGRTP